MPAPTLNGEIVSTALTGTALLADPYLNKGSAFPDDEREVFGLRGLLPMHVSTMEEQVARTYENFRAKSSPIEKYIYLAALHDRNEVLFYRLVQTHITEMVPVIYTPTVGEACQRFSHLFRRSRGLYLSYPDLNSISTILSAAPDNARVIVVTDGERILGLGDLGVGGMGIPVGKLALYTLCAGIDPRQTLPMLLDVGTNNQELLNDPLYLGWRHPRPDRQDYDRFIDAFVKAVHDRWPEAILQWEDFSKHNAWRLLTRHRSELPSFNDDIQGTAAVTVAGLLRAFNVQGRALKDQRIVIAGAGSAATGIGLLLVAAMKEMKVPEERAKETLWLIDTVGLVHEGRTDLSEEKAPFAQKLAHLREAGLDPTVALSLESIVAGVKPTVLIGTSGQPGIFSEALVRTMASTCEKPVIFPLSNPTSKSEATPEQLYQWTGGRVTVATGSPFPAVESNGQKIPIGQCNNAFIFPGVGLGLTVTAARFVPDEVFLVAAKALARFDQRLPGFEKSLFPSLEHVQDVSCLIACDVARVILKRGLSSHPFPEADIPARVKRAMWAPNYPKLKPA